jgi:hypothetical protein
MRPIYLDYNATTPVAAAFADAGRMRLHPVANVRSAEERGCSALCRGLEQSIADQEIGPGMAGATIYEVS